MGSILQIVANCMYMELGIVLPFICFAVKPMVHLYQKLFQCVGNAVVALLSLKPCKRLAFRSRKLGLFRIYFSCSLQGVFSKLTGLHFSAEACVLEQDNLKTFPLMRNVV
jgi:hypothetical protein